MITTLQTPKTSYDHLRDAAFTIRDGLQGNTAFEVLEGIVWIKSCISDTGFKETVGHEPAIYVRELVGRERIFHTARLKGPNKIIFGSTDELIWKPVVRLGNEERNLWTANVLNRSSDYDSSIVKQAMDAFNRATHEKYRIIKHSVISESIRCLTAHQKKQIIYS